VRHCLHDRPRAGGGIRGLENARANKNAVDAELHAEGRVCGGSDPAGGKIHDGKATKIAGLFDERDVCPDLLREVVEFVVGEPLQLPDLAVQCADVADRLHHVPGPGFALRADHGRTFGNPA